MATEPLNSLSPNDVGTLGMPNKIIEVHIIVVYDHYLTPSPLKNMATEPLNSPSTNDVGALGMPYKIIEV